jgi:creatinine amidohydrolase/Fe(II)-dependent formamide hydrolase-like protein
VRFWEYNLSGVSHQGFERILLRRGCGGHALDDLVARFNDAGRARVSLPGHPFHAIWCRIDNPSVPAGHADSFTTSICLSLRPDDVRMERIFDPGAQSVNWDDENPDFAQYSATGVIGDPTHASAELGKELWLAAVEAAASELGEFARHS